MLITKNHIIICKWLLFMHIFLYLEKGYIDEKELDAFFYHMLTKLGVDVSILEPLRINLFLSEL